MAILATIKFLVIVLVLVIIIIIIIIKPSGLPRALSAIRMAGHLAEPSVKGR